MLVFFLLAILSVVVAYLFLFNLEHAICFIRHQVPFVPSAKVLRQAIVNEINTYYPNMKTVCDIGAGYGGLANYIKQKCNVSVVAIENMLVSVMIAHVGNFITGGNVRIIWTDAFKYLNNSNHKFDIGVAYLGPGVNDGLAQFKKNFRVMITLDVPIDNLTPVRIVDIGHGFTRYGRKKFPHKLFVYEF